MNTKTTRNVEGKKLKVGQRVKLDCEHYYQYGKVLRIKTDGREYGGEKWYSVLFDDGTTGCYDLRDERLELDRSNEEGGVEWTEQQMARQFGDHQ